MRFRWSEHNERRNAFLASLCCGKRQVAAVELIHSKNVLFVDSAGELNLKKADGVLTTNRALLPTVTVADCMPIFVYDSVSGAFGVLHSGWRGTGIVMEAASLLRKRCGASPHDLCFVLGSHIGSCCYQVDEGRARHFAESFGLGCVKEAGGRYALSLKEANLALLDSAGVPRANVLCVDECTACFCEEGQFKYGSFRRETSHLAEGTPLEVRQLSFTPQAAFVMCPDSLS